MATGGHFLKNVYKKSCASDLNNVRTDCWPTTTWYKFTFGQYIYIHTDSYVGNEGIYIVCDRPLGRMHTILVYICFWKHRHNLFENGIFSSTIFLKNEQIFLPINKYGYLYLYITEVAASEWRDPGWLNTVLHNWPIAQRIVFLVAYTLYCDLDSINIVLCSWPVTHCIVFLACNTLYCVPGL